MDIIKILASYISNLTGIPEDEAYSAVGATPDPKLGDYAFPCFRLAKPMKKAPGVIAAELRDKISEALPDFLDKVSAEGAFLNFSLNRGYFAAEVINAIICEDGSYGSSDAGGGKTVVIDYSSPNVAHRFHIGHLYSTMIGAALYKIFNFLGYKSYGINFLGDWGTQFGKLIVAYNKWGDSDVLEKDGIEELDKLYVKFHNESENDASLIDEARAWFLKMQNHDETAIKLWKLFCDIILKEYSKQYERLGVSFDSYKGESFYNDKMQAVVDELREKNLLVESEGAQIVDLSKYNMPPCLILRSDGGTLYPTRDIASALYRKKEYDFYKNINVTDMRQTLHFAQWFKVIELMGYDWAADLVHVPYGLISLTDGALSSRFGRTLLLTDILNEATARIGKIIEEKNPDLPDRDAIAEQVGVGAVIFSSLYNSRIKDNVISLDKILSFDGETGPYVQYTHARAANVLEKAGDYDLSGINFKELTDDASFETVKLLSDFQNRILLAAERYEPFIISRYLVSLSQSFNKFYHDNQVITAPPDVKKARLSLVYSVKTVLKTGLALIGLAAPDKM